MKKFLVVSAAVASMAISGVALAKKGDKATNFNCKANGEAVEIKGKTSFTNKEKKKADKECKAKGGKWEKEEAAAAGATEGAPAEGATTEPME